MRGGKMGKINSRAKGARGEREAAKLWAETMGTTARRGQQFSGSKDSPDVVHGLRDIHLEVKNVERGNPYDWLIQSIKDAGDKVPCVLHKRNKKPWILILRLEDVPKFMAAATPKEDEEVGGDEVSSSVPSEVLSEEREGYGKPSWKFRNG